ncbi:acyl carrier protein [Aquimarina algicola]|uniref:Acyl carrier protein n=1 Tax=Aquimarina algicola TaxID=2589995 RepID=A0A504JEM9_9FLAO|nr:acyl carrier protein [Aquimarina algicola]TPN89134.1 acyl carrier protein [Aquimarina algicola]
MNITTIKEKISEILTAILEHTNFELHDELTAKDVDGWDSLSHMMIITKIEEEFGIRFKLRDLNKLKNMGSLITLIQSKL